MVVVGEHRRRRGERRVVTLPHFCLTLPVGVTYQSVLPFKSGTRCIRNVPTANLSFNARADPVPINLSLHIIKGRLASVVSSTRSPTEHSALSSQPNHNLQFEFNLTQVRKLRDKRHISLCKITSLLS